MKIKAFITKALTPKPYFPDQGLYKFLIEGSRLLNNGLRLTKSESKYGSYLEFDKQLLVLAVALELLLK